MMLTKEIDYLFQFCQDQRVYYYEIQAELVDHLANAIEAEMAERKDLTFEAALEKVFADFGPYGFSPIVRQQTKQLTNSAKKVYQQSMESSINIAGLFEALIFCLLTYSLLMSNQFWVKMILFSVFLVFLIKDYILRYQKSTKIKKTGKEFWKVRYFFYRLPLASFILIVIFSFDSGSFIADHHIIPCLMSMIFYFQIKGGKRYIENLDKNIVEDFPLLFTNAGKQVI